MFKIKIYLLFCFILALNVNIYTKIPIIPEKFIIFENANNGYDLYIKKLPNIGSILLTESQKDINLKKTNYGLRTVKFHPCNGNEKRILDGKILQTKYDIYFLVDSTTEHHDILGDSFHFFLPENVLYGYNWSRKGVLVIKPGININLRLFEKKYADYSGEFIDQWITLKLSYSDNRFINDAIKNFKNLSDITKSKNIIKSDDENVGDLFENIIPDNIPIDNDADLVFIIDATISMKEEIPVFKEKYPIIKEKILNKIKSPRIGLIFYRDYGEEFLTRIYDLTDDLKYIDYLIGRISIKGGDDVPEALYEGIFELNNLSFKSKNRIVFLIGDAPAHPTPRGKITYNDAVETLKKTNVKFNTICLPYK